MLRTRSLALIVSLAALAGLLPQRSASAFDVVLSSQGEYLDAYLIKPSGMERWAFVAPNDPAHGGRHINGKACFFPETFRDANGVEHPNPHAGQLVASDDAFDEVCDGYIVTDPNDPRYDRCNPQGKYYIGDNPPGWAVLNRDGTWAQINPDGTWQTITESDGTVVASGRIIHTYGCGPNGQGGHCDINTLSATDPAAVAEGRFDPSQPTATQGTIDPQGCFFDQRGNLWGTDVGHDGDPTDHDGSLIVFFAQSDYHDYCFVDRALFSPAMPEYDSATDTIYLAESGADHVLKYMGPYPTSAADCATLPDHTVTLPPARTVFTTFPYDLTLTPAAIVRKPASDHFYLASVLLLGSINEIDANGVFTGFAAGPFVPNLSVAGNRLVPNVIPEGLNPDGVDVGTDGTLYFSDLNLQTDPTTFTFFSTGCGRMWKKGPSDLEPSLMAAHLRFPDGVTVVSSDLLDLTHLSPPSGQTFCPSE
jgi:hypothetical protein